MNDKNEELKKRLIKFGSMIKEEDEIAKVESLNELNKQARESNFDISEEIKQLREKVAEFYDEKELLVGKIDLLEKKTGQEALVNQIKLLEKENVSLNIRIQEMLEAQAEAERIKVDWKVFTDAIENHETVRAEWNKFLMALRLCT